jgi:uncharacterized damage-inducible protein DinB
MDAQALVKIFEMSHMALTRNLDGITPEESLQAPDPGGNSLNWVLGHILWGRSNLFKMLDLPPLWEPEKIARYARGSAPIGEGDPAAEPFEEIRAVFERSQEPLMEALRSLPAERLAAVDEKGQSLAQRLAMLAFHEGYHGGQAGLLRRLLGREGAIS